MAVGDPGLQLLQHGLEAVLVLDGAVAPGGGVAVGAREAFQDIQKGVNKVSGRREVLDAFLAELPREHRSQLLGFVADFSCAKPMYKKQAAVVVAALLKAPGWPAVAREDEGLLRRLQEADLGTTELLGAPPPSPAAQPAAADEAAAAAAAAAGTAAGPSATGAHAAPEAAATQGAAAPAGGSPAAAAEGPGAAATASGPAGEPPPEAPAASFQGPTPEEEEAALAMHRKAEAMRRREAAAAEAAERCAREAEAASAETKRQLRAAFEAVAALGYEVDKKEAAAGALASLCRAVNRAHWEHERHRCPEANTSPQRWNSGVFGATGGEDPLTEAMAGASWDPALLMRFLFSMQKAWTLQRKRATSVAHMLGQISPVCGDTVRSDAFLAAWLGCVQDAAEPASTISYGLASNLRWAAWDLSWHHANLRRRCDDHAARDHKQYQARRQEVLASVELPPVVLETLLAAAEAAAKHTAEIRFPDESRRKGIIGSIKGLIGLVGDEGPLKDEFMKLMEEVEATGAVTSELALNLRWMIWNIAWYGANKAKNTIFGSDATESLVRAERHFSACFRGEVKPWRGVNLGGWFLLEPGPCSHFWTGLPPEAQAAACEWGCAEALGPEAAGKLLTEHRSSYFAREDFQAMRAAGITHVRLPFGAWCVVGPRPDEPYVGPCLEALDRALDMLEDAGLMVLLDLHGPVGGVSSEPPTGHQDPNWMPEDFDADASLAVLKIVAERYAGRVCVCGLGVANEPAETMSARELARYYEASIRTVRQAGMRPGQVTVLLPIFTEYRVREFMALWEEGYPNYQDSAFDLHFYQCFGPSWHLLSLPDHLRKARERAALLEKLPACSVTEWSLALPPYCLKGLTAEQQRKAWTDFAEAQLQAFESSATHGWFFWTWKDSCHVTWSMRDCLQEGLLQLPSPSSS